MKGKLIRFEPADFAALDQLARDRMMTFQEIADIRDLLKKHSRPTDLKEALQRSAGVGSGAAKQKKHSRTAAQDLKIGETQMNVRIVFATALACLILDAASVSAADLRMKVRLNHHRVHVVRRPWCVIENVGTPVWTCAPTRAECHAYEIPGTSLYCVRDPIPRRSYAMR